MLYTQSGNKIAACRLAGSNALIEHKLYWATVGSIDEARYLTAILNSGPLHSAVEPLMSEGLFGKRDIDKYVFAAPFPTFRKNDTGHLGIARLSETAERVAAEVELRETWGFQKSRRVIREALSEHGIAIEIDAAVAELLAIGLSSIPVRKGDGQKIGADLMEALSNAEEESAGSGKARARDRKKQLNPRQRRRQASSSAGKYRGKRP